jgi:hypothetical protein
LLTAYNMFIACLSYLSTLNREEENCYGSGFDSASNRNEYQESFWEVKMRPACKSDNLSAIYIENVGASTSYKTMGPHKLLQG